MAEKRKHEPATTRGASGLVVGIILVLIGVVFLVDQVADVNIWGSLFSGLSWPLYIILPGLLFFVAMLLFGRGNGALAIPGSLITTVGLILAYQNSTGRFENWAYAWALVAPTSIGVGLVLGGLWSGQQQWVRNGVRFAVIGLIIFVVGWVFFEVVLGLSGYVFGALGDIVGVAAPLLLIGLGVYLLRRRRAA